LRCLNAVSKTHRRQLHLMLFVCPRENDNLSGDKAAHGEVMSGLSKRLRAHAEANMPPLPSSHSAQ
jgi:hypothetical protein